MKSYPVLKTKYTASPVSVEQAKNWLRLDIPEFTDDDDKIQSLIEAAVGYVETECNLSLGISEFEWYVEYLPCKFADTCLVDSIISIESEGDSGFSVIDATNYSLIRTSETTSRIRWINSYQTSSTFFRITFRAGYGEGKIPPRLLQAVRVLVAEWYDDPGDFVREKKTMADRFLQPYIIAYAG